MVNTISMRFFTRSFEQDIEQLKEIPIIPSLLPSNDTGTGTLSILDWIISQDSHKLESLSTDCYKGLAKLDISVIEALQREKKAVIEKAENTSMKEIKGWIHAHTKHTNMSIFNLC